MRKLYSASDIRRFARCPRQWWYEDYSGLGDLTTDEIRARIAELERRHGSAASLRQDYMLLKALLQRSRRLQHGTAKHREDADRVRAAGTGCLAALVVGILLALAIVLVQ